VRTGPELVLHPAEAARRGLAEGQRVRLRSPSGECVLTLRCDPAHAEGVAYATAGPPASGVERLLPPDRGPVRVEPAAER